MNNDAATKCCNCKKPLDAAAKAYVEKYPYDSQDGVLGACCQPLKGCDDHGWGEAPEHGYDY